MPEQPARSRIFLPLAAIAAMAVALVGCDRSGSDESAPQAASNEPTAIVRYVEAWSSPIDIRVRAVGTTRPVDSVIITSEVSARVQTLGFRDEEVVDQGRVLAQLDASLAQADLASAEARRERLRLQSERTADAFRAGASNQSEVDNARTLLAEAVADAQRAQRIVDDHTIKAPFAGRVGRRLVSVGALVNPGDSIAQLQSVDPMEVVFSAPEAYLSAMRVGAQVTATSMAFPDRVFAGALKVTGSNVDAATRTVEVYATIPNPDGALRPGMFLSVELVVGEKPRAVLIPESAVVREGARSDVFIIREGRAHRTRVELGERIPGVVEVVSGVSAGDMVVTQGLQRLRDGVRVDESPDDELEVLGVEVGAAMRDQPGWEGVFAERYNQGGAATNARARLTQAAESDAGGEPSATVPTSGGSASGTGR